MPQTVIENPIINSPFAMPQRHFRHDDRGITPELADGRRKSFYVTPVPGPKKTAGQLALFEEKPKDNELINQIRVYVDNWRQAGYPYVTQTTRRLLQYWQRPDRERKLFFCQIEALETAIYLTEAVGRMGTGSVLTDLTNASQEANGGLLRMAFKMATGSGKTVVMAMLIAWQTLNRAANPRDHRFSDAFLVVTPGITIRDRLQVLKPADPNNYYLQRDLLPPDLLPRLHQARIIITNYHAFMQREITDASAVTKRLLKADQTSAFTETPGQMVNRVCREFGGKRGIIVLNDEAHHCYQRRADGEAEQVSADEREEVKRRDEESRVWISGLHAVNDKLGIKVVYDLSATPFFLKGSGYREGDLFPWVVSDFALIDAIECGIVKIPRVPVADDTMKVGGPVYRNLWLNVRDSLKGLKKKDIDGRPQLPAELEGALYSLYSSYESYHAVWEEQQRRLATGGIVTGITPPPAMIIVCNNTVVSKMVYDWISGYEKQVQQPLPDGGTVEAAVIVPGKLDLFRNEDGDRWLPRPATIVVDSVQLESGEQMSDDFKKAARQEIDRFKDEYRQRYPGRDVDGLTDEDLMREVLNTVGKPGRLGEQVKCVVSVSMLTEGWDASTVTHILGVRAFSTQLICEQVIGRGLRRISYAANADGLFEPEYAEVYGVPFEFIPTAGKAAAPVLARIPTQVCSLPEREHLAITFPNVIGYRYETRDPRLSAHFTADSRMRLTARDVPSMTESMAIVGQSVIHSLAELETRRMQEVEFQIASILLERYYRDATGQPMVWYFPQLLRITRSWMATMLDVADGMFPQCLLLSELAHRAAERIQGSIQRGAANDAALVPILQPGRAIGSSADIDFETRREVWQTDGRKCPVNFVALDSTWEARLAQKLEQMDEVISYVKNDGMNFAIPYEYDNAEHRYVPDFIARIARADRPPLNLIIEVSGGRVEARELKQAKRTAIRTLWLPSINRTGGFGEWDYVDITDIDDALNTLRRHLQPLL